jgi:hypothetical protein
VRGARLLKPALTQLDDPQSVLAGVVLAQPNLPTSVLEAIIGSSPDPVVVVAAGKILGRPDAWGRPRRVTPSLAGRIVSMAARVLGARESLLAVVTDLRLVHAIRDAVAVAAAAGPLPPGAGGGSRSEDLAAWQGWLSRDGVSAARAVAALDGAALAEAALDEAVLDEAVLAEAERGADRVADGGCGRDRRLAALARVADPAGVLVAAAVAGADRDVLGAVLTDEYGPVGWRRAAAVQLLRHRGPGLLVQGRLHRELLTLIVGAPVGWLREVAALRAAPVVVWECLRQPDVATADLLAVIADQRAGAALTGIESWGWDLLLLTAPQTSPSLRAVARRRLFQSGVQELVHQPRRGAGQLRVPAGQGAGVGTGAVLDALDPSCAPSGSEWLAGLPLPVWADLPPVFGCVEVPADWAAPVLAAVLPALADPDVARAVVALAGPPRMFPGTLAELIGTARAVAAPAT